MERVLFVIGWAVFCAVAILALGKLAASIVRRETKPLPERENKRTHYVPPDASDFVRCTYGSHMVSKRRALVDGETYDGTLLHICYQHKHDRKRLMNARESA